MRWLVGLAFFAAAAAQSQTCPTPLPDRPSLGLTTSCDPCLAGQTVTLTLIPRTPPVEYSCGLANQPTCARAYDVQSCDILSWDFGDGTTASSSGAASITHTYTAGGAYHPTITLTRSGHSAQQQVFDLSIGSPTASTFVAASAPLTASESDATLDVTLTRSGNLSVPSTLAYSLQEVYILDYIPPPSPDRLQQTSGTVIFAAGESQKSLSFPHINNDGVYTGSTTYKLTVRSSDGSVVLSGLTQSGSGFERVAEITIHDDDPRPHARIEDVAVCEGTGGKHTVPLTITMDAPLSSLFGIYASANKSGSAVEGIDFKIGDRTLAEDGKSVTVPLEITADTDPEPDETFTLAIANADPQFDWGPIIDRPAATISILNDDISLGTPEIRPFIGEIVTVPVNVGNPIQAGDVVSVTSDKPAVATVVPTLPVGSSSGELKIATQGPGTATINAKVTTHGCVEAALLRVTVAAPVTLAARSDATKIRVGEETSVHVAFNPPLEQSQLVVVQASNNGIIALAANQVTAPAGGEATIALRGVAPGKTTLTIWAPGQLGSATVQLEVSAALGRRRATR